MRTLKDKRRAPESAHVLFTDIVGYSKLPMGMQLQARQQLNEIVRGTETYSVALARSNVISRPAGDAIALIFFGNPEDPVNCAIEIHRALGKHSKLPLRIGIHSGPVIRDEDINQQSDVAGGGINYAQRVMDAGTTGHILLTRAVAENLNQLGGWSEHLHDLGEIEVKHGVRLHVFNLYSGEFGNPVSPERFDRATSAPVTVGIPVSEASPATAKAKQHISTPTPKMSEGDIIEVLFEHLRRNTKDREILIPLLTHDDDLGIPKGSTEKHLEAAAAKADMEIVEPRGATHLRLRRIKHRRVWVSA